MSMLIQTTATTAMALPDRDYPNTSSMWVCPKIKIYSRMSIFPGPYESFFFLAAYLSWERWTKDTWWLPDLAATHLVITEVSNWRVWDQKCSKVVFIS